MALKMITVFTGAAYSPSFSRQLPGDFHQGTRLAFTIPSSLRMNLTTLPFIVLINIPILNYYSEGADESQLRLADKRNRITGPPGISFPQPEEQLVVILYSGSTSA